MRNSLLGVVAGLLLGTLGALAYTHYVGDGGSALADLQAQLTDLKSKLAKAQSDVAELTREKSAVTEQVDHLNATNDTLTKQLTDGGQTPAAAPAPAAPQLNPSMFGAIMSMMRNGGMRGPEQRMFLMQSRLKLTPDQAKTIKAAMDADQQARRDLFRQARQNGTPPDMKAVAAINTLDKTLATTLSTTQQAQYQQLQADEKAARAETMATTQVDQMMPLLQLSDDQKGKAMNAIYQQQLSAADPATLMSNPNPMAALATMSQTTQAAMKNVLSPDQYALYQQDQQVQNQAFGNFAGRRGNGGGGNGGGGNGGNPPGAAPAATPAPAAAAPSPAPAPATTDAAATNATTTATDASTTNAATTNAPPPPPPN